MAGIRIRTTTGNEYYAADGTQFEHEQAVTGELVVKVFSRNGAAMAAMGSVEAVWLDGELVLVPEPGSTL